MKETKTVPFKNLRSVYMEIKSFIEEETGGEIKSLQTTIDADLGCAGDDNYDLLDKFVTKYNLDYADFEYCKHFLSEGELFNSGTALLTLIFLPITIVFWVIKIVKLERVDPFKWKSCLPPMSRETLDLTFGDLLVWYLSGKYSLRGEVKYLCQHLNK